jgi:hypothetical protein
LIFAWKSDAVQRTGCLEIRVLNALTARGGVFFEKLVVAQLLRFLALLGTQRFVTFFIKSLHRCLSWDSPFHTLCP